MSVCMYGNGPMYTRKTYSSLAQFTISRSWLARGKRWAQNKDIRLSLWKTEGVAMTMAAKQGTPWAMLIHYYSVNAIFYVLHIFDSSIEQCVATADMNSSKEYKYFNIRYQTTKRHQMRKEHINLLQSSFHCYVIHFCLCTMEGALNH